MHRMSVLDKDKAIGPVFLIFTLTFIVIAMTHQAFFGYLTDIRINGAGMFDRYS